MPEDKLK